MSIKIGLVGNPNSGKTTMFNDLTGSSQYVGNWPGVTVEKKEGKLKGNKQVIIVDLPGIYSLSPYTLEEVVSRNYLVNDKPDVIINIVDASNIERNLYLTTQLLELGIPVVVALNMIDVVRKNGDNIDIDKLANRLGCKVVETSALKGLGLKELIEQAISLVDQDVDLSENLLFDEDVEKIISEINVVINDLVPPKQKRWHAIKLFEKDEKIITKLKLNEDDKLKIEALINKYEVECDDDSESIITNQRYNLIGDIVKKCIKKQNTSGLTTSDKIDKIVTNRWLAIPIFALVMYLVYYFSISTVGTLATDFVNETLFGEVIPDFVTNILESMNVAEWLSSLILDGIIGGVGAVLGFLPQMLVLFFFLAILEDCGYMARIAFIMDRAFRRFGLSGKSFIPILIGTGCGVPGIMASRTIESEKDRKMTIILTTFIPCSAKIPVIGLIAGALFPDSTWVGPSAYFVGIATIILSGIILKKTKLFVGDTSPFVMELPSYHVPGLKSVLIHMWDRGKSFVKKAGTIIFVACGLIWFLSSFSWNLQMADAQDSMLASIGKVIAPIFNPLGWGDWQAAVATITGIVAKENVVGTFGILYGFEEVAEDGIEIWNNLQSAFTQLSAYSFLLFNLLCAPCFAAIGAIKREMNDTKWTLIAIGYQTGLAYVIAFIAYQLGLVYTTKSFGIYSIIAIMALLGMLYLIFRPSAKENS